MIRIKSKTVSKQGYGTGRAVAQGCGDASTARYADNAGSADRAKSAAEADHATEADHAAAAYLLDADSPTREELAYKDRDDTIAGEWTLRQGLRTEGYAPGLLGVGARLERAGDGTAALDLDYLTVRRKTTFATVEIKHVAHVGGETILSPGGAVIKSVDLGSYFWGDDVVPLHVAEGALLTADGLGVATLHEQHQGGTYGYKCTFARKDGDGTEIVNTIAAGDLVMCRTFNLAEGQRYYWRKCVAVGTDWFMLSTTDCDGAASDVPRAGDEVAVIGSTDPSRSHAIVLTAYGAGAPAIRLYKDITTYDLVGKDKIIIAPDGSKFTGELVILSGGEERPVAEFVDDAITFAVGPEGQITLNGNTRFVDSEGNEVALFADGKLNALLVEARSIRTGSSGARTVIEGDLQEYYDSDGNLRLRVHAGSVDADNAGSGAVTYAAATATANGGTMAIATLPGQSVRFAAPAVSVGVTLTDGGDLPSGLPGGTATAYLYASAGGTLRELWRGAMSLTAPAGGSVTSQQTFAPGTLFVREEDEVLLLRLAVESRYSVLGGASVASGSVAAVAEREFSEIGNDGAVLRSGNGGGTVSVLPGAATLRCGSYGLRVTASGIEVDNGGGWEPLGI